jgi:hypothetical protein
MGTTTLIGLFVALFFTNSFLGTWSLTKKRWILATLWFCSALCFFALSAIGFCANFAR